MFQSYHYQEPTTPSPFAKGGTVDNDRVEAHFNSKELDDLDELQGHTSYDPETGYREYKALGGVFKNPHIMKHVEAHAHKTRQKKAYGGSMGADPASYGRYGDNEIGIITPEMAQFFNNLAGNQNINPQTNKPEYFNLGGFFSGLSNSLAGNAGSFGEAFAPQMANMFGSALQSYGSGKSFKKSMKKGLKSMGSDFAGRFGNHMANQMGQMPPWAQQGMQAVGNVANTARQGGDWRGALQNQFNAQAPQMMNQMPPWMQQGIQGAQTAYNAYQNPSMQPQNWQSTVADQFQQRMPQAISSMPAFMQPAAQSMGEVAQTGLQGGNWRDAMRGQIGQFGQNLATQYGQPQYQYGQRPMFNPYNQEPAYDE